MKKLSLLLSILGVTALSQTASAGADTWTAGYFDVEALEADSTSPEGYWIGINSGAFPNPAGCTTTDLTWTVAAGTATGIEQMNKTLLSAFLAGKKVRVKIKGAANSCSPLNGTTGGPTYPQFIAVLVKP